MKLGIKIAPGNAWKADIESSHPSMVEIWYNAGRPDDYNGIFAYLADKPIDVGLHFWGTTAGLLANTSYPDHVISKQSLALIRATIDAAALHHCAYVNVHPDLYSLLEVNLSTLDIRVASKQADKAAIEQTFLHNMRDLNTYATRKSVVFTVETAPSRDTSTWKPNRDRTRVINTHPIPFRIYDDLAGQNIAIANDFCHTACNVRSDDRSRILQFLIAATRRLARVTKLIHAGFVVPPYNGVDFHDSLDNPIFDTARAIPNKSEMIELLRFFKNRDDVWILVEPKSDHPKNYFLARELLETAGVLTK